jgi:hypothetical protein
MEEHPILFTGPMVRAILEERKTMTRRVIKPQPNEIANGTPWLNGMQRDRMIHCRYGKPGDGLWVKETWNWCYSAVKDEKGKGPIGRKDLLVYAADGTPEVLDWKWRPSIFMPRWASRILLEVTAVRVERLQDITEADAGAEGAETAWCLVTGKPQYREGFYELWDSINKDRGLGWDSNPWVWVVSFKKA